MDGTQDISITEAGNTFTLTLGADPTVSLDGKISQVKDITGFWLLGSNGGLDATLQNQSGFQLKDNSGGGTSASGWFTQNKNGLEPGQSISFTATNFNAAALTDYGLMLHADGIPAHVRIPIQNQAVPEPASMAALLIGAVGLARRRKKA